MLDVFRVRNKKLGPVTDPREIAIVESTLRAGAGNERFDFAPLLAKVRRPRAVDHPEIDFPTRITIENKSASDLRP